MENSNWAVRRRFGGSLVFLVALLAFPDWFVRREGFFHFAKQARFLRKF